MKGFLKAFGISVLFLLASSATALSQTADGVIGKWYTEGNESIVEVYKSADKYYGRIIWLKDPNGDDGKPVLDSKNPAADKKTQQIVGLVIMRNFVFKGDNKWEDGKIYDPESGKTYSCLMRLEGNTLNVRGFIGVSALGRTSSWKRVQ